jgi:hypothetical protein
MILLLVAAAVLVAAPIVAAVLVTVASLREDAARSLTGRPPGPLAAAARRLLCLRTSADNHAGSPAATPRSGQHLPNQAYPEIPLPRSDADQTLTLPRS